MKNKYIVITSIFEPTESVKKFAQTQGYKVIVVGDKKSPSIYECDNVDFISVNDKLNLELETVLPFNHYCRKMLGYLSAMQQGAELIYDTDDDNSPKENWHIPSFEGKFNTVEANQGFVNVYNFYTEQKIWPRGFPLNLINNPKKTKISPNPQPCKVGIWQGLADGDPDVDAIYRLIDNTECLFDEKKLPLVFRQGALCPFNSQNTAFIKELFPLLYLPATVTFRFTDILRGLVAQPIMWNYGYELGFTTATVYQDRNIHNYLKDFESEIPCYLYAEKVIEIATKSIVHNADIYENLYNVYKGLYENNLVKEEELKILTHWIKDVSRILMPIPKQLL